MYSISGSALLKLLAENGLLQSADASFAPLIFRSLSFDSRQAMTEGLFFCKGARFKAEYLAQAQANGAVAYLAERRLDSELPCAIVSDMQRVLALAAAAFYDYPQRSLRLFGVTGTNGKTTVVYNLVNMLQAAYGQRPAFTSTADCFDGTSPFEIALTTPEASVIHELLAHARESGTENVVMECSSQGEKAHRLEGLHFDYGVFTNVTPDHIAPQECHSFEEYMSYKLNIVRRYDNAVINADDPHCDDAVKAAENANRIVTYSLHESSGAGVYARDIRRDGLTTCFTVVTPAWEREMTLSRPGLFNVSNALAACAVGYMMELDPQRIIEGIEAVAVPGRMQYFERNGYRVFVDFGHNRASVTEACRTIKELFPDASLQILFGCSGINAIHRRWELPQCAAPYCSHMYITTEDPFYADPQAVVDEITEYVRQLGCPYTAIVDREECVRTAVARMQRENVLLVTTKGAETYIKVRDEMVPYKGDPTVVEEALSKK